MEAARSSGPRPSELAQTQQFVRRWCCGGCAGLGGVQSLTLDQAEKLALSTLKEAMEDKVTDTNIEIARVTKEACAERRTDAAPGVARVSCLSD